MEKVFDVKRNKQKRRIKDGFLNLLTYLASGTIALILAWIFYFVFINGFKNLSLEMLTNDYWTKNYIVTFEDSENSSYISPQLDDNEFFSTKFGIALIDKVDSHKAHQVIISYVDPKSPFAEATITSKGEMFDQPAGNLVNNDIVKLTVLDTNDKPINVGSQYKTSAKEVVATLDSNDSIVSMFYKTPGGGIWGSLIATILLIFVSLLLSIPLGIGAAIYLREYAKATKLTSFMRQSIEMLSGVPSIIFGLMGIAVFFPITQIFGATSMSILLGGFTLTVMLLPIVIRQTEESLIVVPNGLRNASLSLGATETQTIFKVILPSALPGIISAVLLSISRVIAESAALIYTMGTAIVDNPKILEPATTLAVQIWSVMSGEQPNFELASAISIVILVLVLGMNLIVKIITSRLNRKWVN